MITSLLLNLLIQIGLIIPISTKWIFWIYMFLRQLIFWEIKPINFLRLAHVKRLDLKLIILIINIFWSCILFLWNYSWWIYRIVNIYIVIIASLKFIIYFIQSMQMSSTDDRLSIIISLDIWFIWILYNTYDSTLF